MIFHRFYWNSSQVYIHFLKFRIIFDDFFFPYINRNILTLTPHDSQLDLLSFAPCFHVNYVLYKVRPIWISSCIRFHFLHLDVHLFFCVIVSLFIRFLSKSIISCCFKKGPFGAPLVNIFNVFFKNKNTDDEKHVRIN